MEIRDTNGNLLYAADADNIRQAVIEAVAKHVNLSHANLVGVNLERANLENAKLMSSHLEGARLMSANLVGTNLKHACLTNADLTCARLVDANLERAYLLHANLRSANFVRANLMSANLTGANLIGACLRSAYLADVNLSGAKLIGANLEYAYLAGARLVGADFSSADLSGTYLVGANLDGAKLNRHLVDDLAILRAQPGKVRAYKLVNKDGYGPHHGGIKYEIGSTIEEPNSDYNEHRQCGAGINLASLAWCCRHWHPGYRILSCEFDAQDIVTIPIGTDGKFRVRKCRVLSEVSLSDVGLE